MQTDRFRVVCFLAVSFAVIANCTFVFSDETSNAAARAYNGAAALQNAGRHERAAEKWTEFIAAFPNDDRIQKAHYYLGVCRLRSEQFPRAAETFAKVLSTWPDFAQADSAQYNLALARYEQAIRSDNQDLFRQAAEDFSLVTAKYPQSNFADDSLYFRGDCLFQLGDVAAALPNYQKLIDQYSNSGKLSRAYYDLGIGQHQLGKLEEAAKAFQAFVGKPEFASDELMPEVRLRLAICLDDLKRHDQAAKEFDAVSKIADFPMADLARFRFGQALILQGKHSEAAKVLAEFSGKFSDSPYKPEALKSAGHCLFLTDKHAEAERVLKGVAEGDSTAAAEAAYWLGKTQLKRKRPEDALKTLESAVGRFASSTFFPALKLARIDALREIPGRQGETLALYESFLKEFPGHELAGPARYMAALSALDQSQFAKAKAYANEVLRQRDAGDSAVPGSMYIVAESSLLDDPEKGQNRVEAEKIFRELVSKYPDHPRAARSHLRIGWCLHSNEKYDDAIGHLQASLGKFDRQTQLPEAQFIIGRCHASRSRHEEAIKALDAALAASDRWEQTDEVLIAAADSHRALGQADAAVGRLRKLIDTMPKSPLCPLALYRLGELAQQRDRDDEAVGWFQRLVEQHAKSDLLGPSLHALATVAYRQKQFPQAVDWSNRLIGSDGDAELKKRGLYLRGLAHHGAKDHAEAIEDFGVYLRDPVVDTETTTARHLLTLSHIALGQLPQAGEVLEQLLAAKPDFGHADKIYYELAHAWLAEPGKASEAAQTFQTLGEKYPDSGLAAEAWFRVGQFHREKADRSSEGAEKQQAYSAAETALTRGLAKATDVALKEKLQYRLGDLFFQQDKFADAVKTHRAQIAEFPGGDFAAPARFFIAESHYRQDQFDQALPMFLQVGDGKFPDDQQANDYRSQSLYRAGDCAAHLKRWPESEKHYRRLVDHFAQFSQVTGAAYGLAYALQQQGKTDEAIKTYEGVTRQTESEVAAKARFMIGEIAFGQKRYEDAIEHFLLVTVGYPYDSWQALARFETARCFQELGEKDRATATLREMIQKHPGHPRTPDAKRMLEQ